MAAAAHIPNAVVMTRFSVHRDSCDCVGWAPNGMMCVIRGTGRNVDRHIGQVASGLTFT